MGKVKQKEYNVWLSQVNATVIKDFEDDISGWEYER